ncbi:MAG: mechanosensitive ion channel domain-containing protein [Acidimicrobiia bacterium]
MTLFQQLPSTDSVTSIIDTDSLTVWDFVWALCVMLLAFLVARVVRRALRPILRRFPNLSREGALVISRASGWVIILLGVVYALVILNVDMGPALIVIIIIGVVVFFAGRGIVENFASGLVLQASPMFAVGDQIVTTAGTGIVKEVTGRTVRIETMDGEGVFIPNKELINEPITNLTDFGARRSTFKIGVRYGTDLVLAARVLEAAAVSCDTTHEDPVPEALISEMGDHSIEFMLRFWHHPGILESERAKDAVGHAITRDFAKNDIVIAFQQLTMWWGDDTSGTA